MIHYHHVTGLGQVDTGRFLRSRHGLISYVRQDYQDIVFQVCETVIMDNGAFSVWKRGIEFDVEGFTRWVEDWYRHPTMEWALIPDSIEGDETDNDALLRDWPGHLPGVPVWHMHEDIARLERLCKEYRVVALGSSGVWSSPGTEDWWARMSEAMDYICDDDGWAPCKLHGLRMLDPQIFSKLPLHSADSINAVRNCNQENRFGMYVPVRPSHRAEVIATRVEQFSSSPVWRGRRAQMDLFRMAA